jgi:hypothetical protein
MPIFPEIYFGTFFMPLNAGKITDYELKQLYHKGPGDHSTGSTGGF